MPEAISLSLLLDAQIDPFKLSSTPQNVLATLTTIQDADDTELSKLQISTTIIVQTPLGSRA